MKTNEESYYKKVGESTYIILFDLVFYIIHCFVKPPSFYYL